MADVVWHNVLGAVLLKELISYIGYESRPMVASGSISTLWNTDEIIFWSYITNIQTLAKYSYS